MQYEPKKTKDMEMTKTAEQLRLEFLTAQEMGQLPILIHWDLQKNGPSQHPIGWQDLQPQEYQPGFNAMAVRPNENFVFIDIDTKNTSRGSADDLKNYVLIMLQEMVPETILKKIYIEGTRSNGLHLMLMYKAPEKKVAIATGPRGEELVALYRVNSLCYTYPTPGYYPIHGSREDMEPLTKEEVLIIVRVLKVLDEPKVSSDAPVATTKQIVSRPPHWALFDRQVSDEVFIKLLDLMGLERCQDQPRHRRDVAPYEAWRRKESDNPGISAKVFLGREPKVLLFTSSMPQFPSYHTHAREGDWSLTASKILFYLHNQDTEQAEAAISQIAEQDNINIEYVVTASGNVVPKNTFWEYNKGKLQLMPDAVLSVLREANYHRFQDSFVQVTNNIAEIVDVDIHILPFLCEMARATDREVGNFVMRSIKAFIKGSVVLEELPELPPSVMLRDTNRQVWRFFRNCAVRITNEYAEPVAYHQLNGVIWKSHILDRDFSPAPYTNADTFDFLSRLAGDDKHEDLMALIGYNCTRYNQPDNARVTMILEDIREEMEGRSEGGSGKSLLAQFPKYACGSQVFIDGKNTTRLTGDFAWQRINPDTRSILIDDADKRLKLEWLFALTTGDFIVNRKNREEVVIPFEDKPKLIITSNFAIGESNNSTNRRVYSFAVKKVFSDTYQPRDAYGRLFFDGYTDQDWAEFDTMINDCIKLYLSGKLKNLSIDDTTRRRQLINNTDPEFVQFMDSQLSSNFFDWCPLHLKDARAFTPEGALTTNAVNVDKWAASGGRGHDAIFVTKEALLTKMKAMGLGHLTMKTLTKWVAQWAESRKVGIETDYRVRVKRQGFNTDDEELSRAYRITSIPEQKPDADGNLPF
jgi:hypothetical protein